jgi:hypothetical protein
MNAASQIVEGLTAPGSTLVFCDDSDITDSPHENLAPNLRILCALVLSSEDYALIKARMENKLKMLGENLIEFHATEIVNPKKTSSWFQVSEGKRINALKFLKTLLVQWSRKLFYAFVTKQQYLELRKKAQSEGPVSVAYKQGLKRVFLRCLFERLAYADRTVVLLDQDRPQEAPTIECWPEGNFLLGGGPISAGSALIPGLQLADMAAFCITRYLRKRPCIVNGNAGPFDTIAAETLAGLGSRVECLLGDTGGSNVEY